jgi:lysyl-tRNA synthetase class I
LIPKPPSNNVPQSRYDIFMNLKFAVSLGSALLVLKISAFALDPEKQAIIDRYKQPFAVYLTAINDLGSALDTVTTESDLIKAADKFCDQANKFVDEFNANKERFADSQVVQSMDDDPDSKRAMEDYMESLKSKLEDARPIFENLISSLNRHSDSREIDRVRDRVAATFQRIQLLYM